MRCISQLLKKLLVLMHYAIFSEFVFPGRTIQIKKIPPVHLPCGNHCTFQELLSMLASSM